MSDNRIEYLIVGHKGQDGTILTRLLDCEGISWIGIARNSCTSLPISSAPVDISQPLQVENVIHQSMPQKVIYLAAHHISSTKAVTSPAHFRSGLAVNVTGPLNFLEAIAKYSPATKFLYTSSSLIYAPSKSSDHLITEASPKVPDEPYGYEKMIAGHYCAEYRNKHGIFASVSIPFNHESGYRAPGFFSRDVTDAIAKIHYGLENSFKLGTLGAVVDWLYAEDVVKGMRAILELDNPADYIISSGQGHSTGEFARIACEYAGVDFEKTVLVDQETIYRKNNIRIGDSSKLRSGTGWKPTIGFKDLVNRLMQKALDRFRK